MKKMRMLLSAGMISILAISLILSPQESVKASVEGLKIFWNVILPSMLPFFVLSELLLGLGVVHFLGVLLEPLMRPLFNVPGVGAFALSMGLAAGYPMDAVITGKFRRSGLCTQIEGERLLSFTNTADPLFVFGAVAVGMFGRPDLGIVLAIAHYTAAFSIGFLFKYYRFHDDERVLLSKTKDEKKKPLLSRAADALIKGREEDGRSFGRLLGDAVRESMLSLFTIGGFIMLFAVFVKMMEVYQVLKVVTPMLGELLSWLGISTELGRPLFVGLLEIDLGTAAVAATEAPLVQQLIMSSWIIAWSGLCVHGQVASVIHETDIRMGPYFVARLLHGTLAGIYTWLLLGPLAAFTVESITTKTIIRRFNPMERIVLSWQQMLVALTVLIFLAWIFHRFNDCHKQKLF